MAAVAILGILGLRYARLKLEAEREKGPSIEEILTMIEQRLYKFGKVNLKEGLEELPRDRALKALSMFYNEHKTKWNLSYSEFDGTLTLSRHEAIQDISACFNEIRHMMEDESIQTNKTPDVPDLISKIIKRFQSQFGFDFGKPYQLKDIPAVFKVFSIAPIGLESILPNPFPIIFYSSNDNFMPHTESLQKILNKLDVPSRFAILIPAKEESVTKETVQRRFGGLGRENIVVL
jgi:hypothetical protein